jgi:stalled ribosome rescue protein Dom34
MKKIGIWIDKEKAQVVYLNDSSEKFETIFSEIEFFNRTSSSGSRVKTGSNQDITHESTYTEREKHQLKAYFNNLANAIKEADAIAIFGPADTNEKFRKNLKEHHKQLASKIKTVSKADSMTENQVKALVRDYFKNIS